MGDGPGVAPTGTVTFLFSDVVGSTRLWAEDADAMAVSLRLHDSVFRRVIADHEGYVFSTAGDSFAAAFARPTSAVACAEGLLSGLDEADWDGGPELAVRLGLHLGEADERDGNYFGPPVNLAARVMAAAHGGQCLLTRSAAESAAAASTRDLGDHTLRDIDGTVHLFQLGDGEFPPLLSATTGIVALPSPRTSLVGREEDVAHVRRLVADHRLVTLTGVGGCGKTRLAIEVARRELATFPQGVWFADLSAVASDDAIYGAFASALDVVIPDREHARDGLVAYLAPREALLVVDNCEHVIDEVAELVDHLLGESPKLRILATSRESLELDGERAWKVPSLSAADGAAADLFVERAVGSGATIRDDAATATVIHEIVEHLDGVPLAIELAAARTRSMELTDIRDRLDDRFRILSGGKRRSRQRQATLEAAVQWSYDLLDIGEQRALQRLSVFQGGFDLADVGAVLDLDDATAIDFVDALVAKSLVDVTRDVRGAMRHRLLETVRLFGLSRLIGSGDADEIRDRHLDRFVDDRVARTMSDWLAMDSLWRIDREYENFRAAIEWALERDRPDAAAKLAAIISDAAPPRGDAGPVIEWMQHATSLENRDRVFVHALLGHALNVNGRLAEAMTVVPAAIELGDRLGVDDAIFARLDLAYAKGYEDGASGLELEQEAVDLATERFGDVNVATCAAMYLLAALAGAGDHERVVAIAAERAAQWETFGFAHIVEAWRAYSLLELGRTDDARAAVEAFSAVPPSSQWGVMNLAVEHVVLAATEGVDVALRAYAPRAAELVARRPFIAADLLVVFGLLEMHNGDSECARRCADLTVSGNGPIVGQLLVELHGRHGAGPEERVRLGREEARRIPIEERMRNRAAAPALLADAIARWS